MAEIAGESTRAEVAAGHLPPWQVDELPPAPRLNWSPAVLIGPGLMMAGAAIGGGEWLMGPAVTAKYGGVVMWIALVSILFQVVYNLEIMRYTAYCGEPIIVGFFRIAPGPRFWTLLYLAVDFFGIWPYLAANAAVPISAAILGHLPGEAPTKYLSVEEAASRFGLPPELVVEYQQHSERFGTEAGKRPVPVPYANLFKEERQTTRRLAFGVFLICFVPLFLGGKIYNSLEKMMVVKLFLVLGYLIFLGIFYVAPGTWIEISAGLIGLGVSQADGTFGFKRLGEVFGGTTPVDWSLLAAFAAIAGQGGMTNSQLSTYVRDKGWAMGGKVGAVPSMIGGKGIALSHTGKVFRLTPEMRGRWEGWMRVLRRDQLLIWSVGCILGVTIPALVSLEFVRNQELQGDAIAAATARGIVDRTGIQTFWFTTLLCGFIVLVPSQISQIDGIIRRWTDLLWTGSSFFRRWKGEDVKYVYYGLLAAYAAWGLLVLVLLPDPLLLTKFTGGIMNFALGFSAFHTLAVNLCLLPRELRPGWFPRVTLAGCGVFFLWISYRGLHKTILDLGWLG